jgi:hypothetical protein
LKAIITRNFLASALALRCDTAQFSGAYQGRGRITLGLNVPTHYTHFHTFISICKHGSKIVVEAATGAGRAGELWSSNTPPYTAKSPWGVYLYSYGELINPLPANFINLRLGINQGPLTQAELPAGYSRENEDWQAWRKISSR